MFREKVNSMKLNKNLQCKTKSNHIKKLFLKFRNIHRKKPVLESLFNKDAEIDSNTGVSCEYCDIFKNTCFEEHLQAVVSAKQASKKLLPLSKVAQSVIFSDAQWKILMENF